MDRFATVNGLRIHYLDWGTAGRQPLILLHGIARLARTFDHLAPHFSRDYHVIAVDMRGHGDSDWDPRAEYRVEDYTRDIEGLIEQLGLRNIVLWGNSTGGRVAQVIAGSNPERVAARTGVCFVARLDPIGIGPAPCASHPSRPGHNASRAYH